MLLEIKQEIAAEHGYSVEDVTTYDFNIYVGQFTSQESDDFEYDRKKGIEEHRHSFGFL